MVTKNYKRDIDISKLKAKLFKLDYRKEPFLYHLPELLKQPEFNQVNPEHAIIFSELALKEDRDPIVKDALKILNKLIDPETGKLNKSALDIFYGNNSFFWNELGNNTQAQDIVLHIFNKIVFLTNIGK